MRAVIQRVKEANVSVDGEVIGAIGPGLLLFLGIHKEDDESKISWFIEKVVNLRIGAKMAVSLVNNGPVTFLISR